MDKKQERFMDALSRRPGIRPKSKPKHPLETVPFFQRPSGSSTEDRQVGTDDAGNPVFQGRLGTYTVSLNPDQRTLRTKVEEAIPRIKETVGGYLKDPKLPTKDQLKGFAKQAGQSAVSSVEDLGDLMFKGRGTLGDVFSLAAGAGAASVPFDVPQGALRIFGGVGVEGAYKDKNLKKAIKLLKKANVDPTNIQESYFKNKEIWKQTGWFVDPTDGQWRFEIDDSKSFINKQKFKEKSFVSFDEFKDESVDPRLRLTLKDIFKHEELYKRYPELQDKTIILYSDPKSAVRGKVTEGDKIFINAGHKDFNNLEDIKSTLLHEIQHVIQNKEVGFAPGASPVSVNPELLEEKSKELDKLKSPLIVKEAALKKKLGDFPFKSLSPEEKKETLKELQNVQDKIYFLEAEELGAEYQFYRGASGEIEARLVQRRAEGSDQFPVDERINMRIEESLKTPNKSGLDYTSKLDPYLYKKAPREEPKETGFLSKVKKKIGLAEEVADETKKEMISVFPKPERMFPEESRPKGGDYLNPATGEVLSGRNVSSAKLSISPEGKPSFKVSNDNVETVGSTGKGKTQIKTNLFKKKAGWKWTKAPEGMENIGTLISVQNKGKHFYTIETDFSKGVNLKKYPDSKTEPRLRPTVVGELEIGPQIGTISVRGKKHPVYQNIKTFNKGGTVMNRQMEMAFMQQGGLKDDGMKIDPVSGNQIPPGSMAKEVRDDIPAQLSEGEYVVPADVVQYYGVKHFEDLRNKAKGGLSQMERDGRIGGEPVPAGGPKAGPAGQMMKQQPPPMPPKPPATSGMTQAPMPPAPKQMAMGGPLSGEEMQEIRKMANGGMVQMADPYQQQKAMYQQPQSMFNGGPVIPNIGTGFSWEATGPGSITPQPPKQVTLYGPNGEVENLILPADQTKYDTLIAQGYTETAPVTPTFTSSRGKDKDRSDIPDPKPWYETTDFTAGSAGGKASAAKYFGAGGKIGSVVGGIAGSLFGGPVGGAIGSYGIKVSNLASARAEATLRRAMGDANGANALDEAIENQLKTSKALGYADDAIDDIFGSDGDMKVIDALQAAGIKVDRSLRDDDLKKFMKDLSSNDIDKLIGKYGDKKITPSDSKIKKETLAPKDDKYKGEKVEDSDFTRRFNPSAIGKLKSEVEKDNLASAIGVSRDQYDTMSEYERSERLAGNAKGGLMQRKKVKKK